MCMLPWVRLTSPSRMHSKSAPSAAGIGSGSIHDTEQDKELTEDGWMAGWMDKYQSYTQWCFYKSDKNSTSIKK